MIGTDSWWLMCDAMLLNDVIFCFLFSLCLICFWLRDKFQSDKLQSDKLQ